MYTDEKFGKQITLGVGLIIVFSLLLQTFALVFFPDSWLKTMADFAMFFAIGFGSLFLAAVWLHVFWNQISESRKNRDLKLLDRDEKLYGYHGAVLKFPRSGSASHFVTVSRDDLGDPKITGLDVNSKFGPISTEVNVLTKSDEERFLQQLFGDNFRLPEE